MSIIERNLQFLRNCCPEAAGQFEQPKTEHPDIVLRPARNGQKTMQFSTNGRMLYVHSAYDPDKEARGMAEAVSLHYDSVILVFGLGLMYHVKALAARAYEKCRLILIEPDFRVFARVLHEIDLSEIITPGKVVLSIGQTGSELASILNAEITHVNFMQTETVKLPAYIAKYPDVYAEFERELSRVVERRSVENTTTCNQSAHWARNIIKNTRYLPESVRHWTFRDKFVGRPGVVVSSGPSLDKNVGLLRHLKDKAFIIAAYTSLETLRENGIEPDVVASIDSRQLMRENETELKEPLRAPLLYISKTDYRLVDKAAGGKIFATMLDDNYIRAAYAEAGYEDGALYSSGSVAIAATDFAAIAGCDPIIFVGQDLAFTGQKLHSAAGEALDHRFFKPAALDKLLSNTFPVDDVFGGKVPTSPVMDLYRRTLEEYIEYDAGTFGRRYIDATEGGALIAGTEVLSLAETLGRIRAEELSADVGEIFRAHLADDANRVFDAAFAEGYLREIESTHHDMAASADIRALAELDAAAGDSGVSLADRVSAYLSDRAKYFDIVYRFAENRFIKLHGQDYINRRLSDDARAAYLTRQSLTAQILLEWLEKFGEKVVDVPEVIRELVQAAE